MLGGGEDAIEILHCSCIAIVLGVFLQHFRVADDGVQRRTQFVAHIGQELRFGEIGAVGLVTRVCEIVDAAFDGAGLGDECADEVGDAGGRRRCAFILECGGEFVAQGAERGALCGDGGGGERLDAKRRRCDRGVGAAGDARDAHRRAVRRGAHKALVTHADARAVSGDHVMFEREAAHGAMRRCEYAIDQGALRGRRKEGVVDHVGIANIAPDQGRKARRAGDALAGEVDFPGGRGCVAKAHIELAHPFSVLHARVRGGVDVIKRRREYVAEAKSARDGGGETSGLNQE